VDGAFDCRGCTHCRHMDLSARRTGSRRTRGGSPLESLPLLPQNVRGRAGRRDSARQFITRSPATVAGGVGRAYGRERRDDGSLDRGISLARLQAEINRVSYAGLPLFAS
jgi:hypothetical protein